MNICYIITIIIFTLLLFVGYFLNNHENFAIDLESIANIASIYNTDQMKVTNLDVTQNFNLLPRGCVIAWFGGATAPAGWVLCDGQNGTPDLRSRFIIGAGQGGGLSNYDVNAIGGDETVTLTNAQMPAHSHSYSQTWQPGPQGYAGSNRYMLENQYSRSGETGSVGNNQPHNNMPPYYALAYIMKT